MRRGLVRAGAYPGDGVEAGESQCIGRGALGRLIGAWFVCKRRQAACFASRG